MPHVLAMFAAACKIAADFTLPVVVSTRVVSGKCGSMIGAFVVVNKDGWAISAFHILNEIRTLREACNKYQAHEARVHQIEGDASLGSKQKNRAIAKLGKPDKRHPTHFSPWWAADNWQVKDFIGVPAVDLAMLRLDPFDASRIDRYPVFKDPNRDFDPGTSLCRIGFPFHDIEPTYDAATNLFTLPNGALPLPRFPIEGILTRIIEVDAGVAAPYLLAFLETSSPGLKGQSGGPIFDRQGTVWGLQSRTQHYRLGFSPEVAPGQKEHQFLNAGLGTHAATIIGAMKDNGIAHDVSQY